MGILAISLVNFVAGSIMGPTSDEEKGRGFIGFNGDQSLINFIANSLDHLIIIS